MGAKVRGTNILHTARIGMSLCGICVALFKQLVFRERRTSENLPSHLRHKKAAPSNTEKVNEIQVAAVTIL